MQMFRVQMIEIQIKKKIQSFKIQLLRILIFKQIFKLQTLKILTHKHSKLFDILLLILTFDIRL